MTNKLEKISLSVLAFLFLLPNAPQALAAGAETQYGVPYGAQPGKPSEIEVNKEVFNPKLNKFVDNIPATGSDANNFTPGEEITFRIKVKNVSDHTLGKVEVHDNLPQFIEKVSGDFAHDLIELKTGQEDVRELKARVVTVEKLPQDRAVVCDVNTVVAQSGDSTDRDTAQVCVEKKAAKELPKAGPTDFLQVLLGSSLLGFAGIKLFGLRTIKH